MKTIRIEKMLGLDIIPKEIDVSDEVGKQFVEAYVDLNQYRDLVEIYSKGIPEAFSIQTKHKEFYFAVVGMEQVDSCFADNMPFRIMIYFRKVYHYGA